MTAYDPNCKVSIYFLLLCPQFKFHNLEQEVKEINVNKQALKRNLLDLKELHHILEKTAIFFREAGRGTMVGAMEAETREEKKGIPGTCVRRVYKEGRGSVADLNLGNDTAGVWSLIIICSTYNIPSVHINI